MWGQQHSVTLTWTDILNPPPPATTYTVYRATSSASCTGTLPFTVQVASLTVETWVDVGVIDGGIYCYYVEAVDTVTGDASLPSTRATAAIVPHAPVLKAPVIH
ncbi:MAG TPA: hypothetical protein VGH05_20850 [Buttiauxella sp.]